MTQESLAGPVDRRAWTDAEWIAAIGAAEEPRQFVELVFDFYHGEDGARAARQPRELMYLHIGMLTGMVMRVLEPRKPA